MLRADARRYKELTWMYSIYSPPPVRFYHNQHQTVNAHCQGSRCDIDVCVPESSDHQCCLCWSKDAHAFPHLVLYCGHTAAIRQRLVTSLSLYIDVNNISNMSWVYRLVIGHLDGDLTRGCAHTRGWYLSTRLDDCARDFYSHGTDTGINESVTGASGGFHSLSARRQRRVLSHLGKQVIAVVDTFVKTIHHSRLTCGLSP